MRKDTFKPLNEATAPGVGVCGYSHLTTYRDSAGALIEAVIASSDQFLSVLTNSAGYKGWKRNSSQRWSARRVNGTDFEVYRWREERTLEPSPTQSEKVITLQSRPALRLAWVNPETNP